jgi:predicted transporter
MDMQTIFYGLGIIFMLLWIGILIGAALVVWKLQKKAAALKTSVSQTMGLGIGSFLLSKIRSSFSKKKK